MTKFLPDPAGRAAPRRWLHCGWIACAAALLAINVAVATVPNSNELGVKFKVLKASPTVTVEIRMTPRRDFDSVTVEAASGVATLVQSCAFSNLAVAAGHSYVCQVDLTGKPTAAAMTLNLIGRRAVPGGVVPVMEVHHLSVKNPSFAPSTRKAASSHHDVANSGTPAQ